MPRLINADKLVEYKASGVLELTEWQKGWNDAIDTIISEVPIVKAEPVRYGKWLDADDGIDWTCSRCRHDAWANTPYCPNCGARMD